MPDFIDANIFVRHLTLDHPDQSPRATAYFEKIERGEVKVRLTSVVLFEVVFTLERSYRQPRSDIRDSLVPLIGLPGIIFPGKRRLRHIFDLYVDLNIPFGDACIVEDMQREKAARIVSFDADFDKVPGITRIEP